MNIMDDKAIYLPVSDFELFGNLKENGEATVVSHRFTMFDWPSKICVGSQLFEFVSQTAVPNYTGFGAFGGAAIYRKAGANSNV